MIAVEDEFSIPGVNPSFEVAAHPAMSGPRGRRCWSHRTVSAARAGIARGDRVPRPVSLDALLLPGEIEAPFRTAAEKGLLMLLEQHVGWPAVSRAMTYPSR